MENFDQLKVNEVDKRGFLEKTDLGWGLDGVFESTTVSQSCLADVVCALPHMIHKSKSEKFRNVTGLFDQMTDFMDKYFLDNRCKLFDNPLCDEQFASQLRSIHGREKCSAEAFTIARQKLGTITNLTEGECNFDPTERHM